MRDMLVNLAQLAVGEHMKMAGFATFVRRNAQKHGGVVAFIGVAKFTKYADVWIVS
jgi:hypothetical protein